MVGFYRVAKERVKKNGGKCDLGSGGSRSQKNILDFKRSTKLKMLGW